MLSIRSFPLIIFLALSPLVSAQETESPEFDQSEAFELLGRALTVFDEMDELPEERFIGRDQQSAQREMNQTLRRAVEVLDIPALSDMRDAYRRLEEQIADEQARIAELRERRIFAQDSNMSTLNRMTPGTMLRSVTASTRGDYDALIEARQANVAAHEGELKSLKQNMSDSLAAIDLDMSSDQIEVWLSSAIGDDVLSMSVVFRSISAVTAQLAELTRESGENLAYAKRYYGMMVILHKLVVDMQESFIAKVDNEVLPKLATYRAEAEEIIAQSRSLIQEGGNRSTLESNIQANELTQRAIDLYKRTVEDQRDRVADSMILSAREEQVSINTYRTVQLSSNVAELIRDGMDTFDTLSSLQMPVTAGFQNQEIRQEFRKLTDRMSVN